MGDPAAGVARHDDDAWLDALCMHNLLDDADEVIYFKDRDSRFLRVSGGCARLHRRTQADLIGLSDHDLFHREHADQARADEVEIMRTGVPMLDMRERETWPDREDSWVSSSKFPLRDDAGAVIGTFGISRDITSRVRAEQERERAAEAVREAHARTSRLEAQLRAVLDGSRDPIFAFDADLRVHYLNPAAADFVGRPAGDVVGRTCREIGVSEDRLRVWEPALQGVLAGEGPTALELAHDGGGEHRWYHVALTPDAGPDGVVVGVQAALREITEMKRAGQALAHQATHCPLTGLANRYLLMDRAERALARLERRPATVVLLFVDLDGFKAVNDTHGHRAGDAVLAEAGRRLGAVARRTDTAARLGGDEFVLLCESTDGEGYARRIAERVVEALATPYVLPGGSDGAAIDAVGVGVVADPREAGAAPTVRVSASVGVALTRDPGMTPDRLLGLADAAMYVAKEAGGAMFRFADRETY